MVDTAVGGDRSTGSPTEWDPQRVTHSHFLTLPSWVVAQFWLAVLGQQRIGGMTLTCLAIAAPTKPTASTQSINQPINQKPQKSASLRATQILNGIA